MKNRRESALIAGVLAVARGPQGADQDLAGFLAGRWNALYVRSMPTLPHQHLRRFVRHDTKERALVVEVGPIEGKGWLLFFTFLPNGDVLERRRLAEFSERWHDLPDEALSALHDAAVHVNVEQRVARQRELDARPREGEQEEPDLAVAKLTRELDAAKSALEIAYLQLDSLALMLADSESELEQATADAATLNAEIQDVYRRAGFQAAVEGGAARRETRVPVTTVARVGAGGERQAESPSVRSIRSRPASRMTPGRCPVSLTRFHRASHRPTSAACHRVRHSPSISYRSQASRLDTPSCRRSLAA